MVKILITGSAGFVGKNCFELLKDKYEVCGVSKEESKYSTHRLDLTEKEKLVEVLDKENPDVIIHCAALTNVDYNENNREETHKNNVTATKNLVDWAKLNSKKIVFISSDYVYSGETGNYNEESDVGPLNYYGITKLEGEKLVSELNNYAILRTTVVFGYDVGGMNFLMQLLRQKEKRNIPIDQINNATDVKVLANYVSGVIEKDLKGIFVATGPEPMGRYEFTKMICKIFDLNLNLFKGVETSELNSVAKRPLNNSTSSIKIREALNYEVPSLEQSLRLIKEKWMKKE